MVRRHGRRFVIPWGMVKRIGVYAAVMFLLSVAENSFFASVKILPATPDLILGALVVIAVTDSKDAAIISGVLGGIISDALGGTGVYLSPIFYLCVALLTWFVAHKMMAGYLSWLAVFPIACVMRAAFTLLQIYLFGRDLMLLDSLAHVILPEVIVTFVFSLPLYPIIRLCTAPLHSRHDMSLR